MCAYNDIRGVLLGLDCAEKTMLLYRLKTNHTIQTIPTIGFNVETIKYKKMHMTVWDIGGQSKLLSLWKHYFHGADFIIFILDSSDSNRFEGARYEFFKICTDQSLNVKCILFFANKSDMINSFSLKDIFDIL